MDEKSLQSSVKDKFQLDQRAALTTLPDLPLMRICSFLHEEDLESLQQTQQDEEQRLARFASDELRRKELARYASTKDGQKGSGAGFWISDNVRDLRHQLLVYSRRLNDPATRPLPSRKIVVPLTTTIALDPGYLPLLYNFLDKFGHWILSMEIVLRDNDIGADDDDGGGGGGDNEYNVPFPSPMSTTWAEISTRDLFLLIRDLCMRTPNLMRLELPGRKKPSTAYRERFDLLYTPSTLQTTPPFVHLPALCHIEFNRHSVEDGQLFAAICRQNPQLNSVTHL